MPKTAEEFRRLPYRRRLRPEEDSSGDRYFVAWIEEIPWIRADGESRDDALYELGRVFGEAIRTMLEAGDSIPEPALWPESVGSHRSGTGRADEAMDVVAQEELEVTPDGTWEDALVVDTRETAGVA